ncbi:gephyrin-like molybdotransferase Glp [Afifella sp. IM 167]|uniref:molybdopterin molybdotransferase MoeA n=1 Tax=Afifella sp. IM 167 TaxID=2033586 RepID=UPI001CCD0B51|nr:gephyrin-like molybdotransferase Glp [Afifella sp. IM 167]MBZ8132329.1 molybdopterin molybdenumtransferase MoeA [Afifella sp. IM 167]
MSLISVEEALQRVTGGITPTEEEVVPLARSRGRVLAHDLAAQRDQPPFPASAMDGYAVRAGEARQGARLKLVGTSRAGERFRGSLGAGETVRIFTGAPVPEGADTVLIQENAERDGDMVIVREAPAPGRHIRPAGLDFSRGQTLLAAGTRLGPREMALAAAMNHGTLAVRRRPRVAVLSTGDELVVPGETPGPDQIVSSNGAAVTALAEAAGAEAVDLGIAVDSEDAIADAAARAGDADILVVIGGASVGDHDLVQPALAKKGMQVDFWKIAMRPGKPLMFGVLGPTKVLGLPGNPVSALICGIVFLRPLIAAFLGLEIRDRFVSMALAEDIPANNERQEFMRGRSVETPEGPRIQPAERQDSSLLATFARSDVLILRPAHAPAAKAGEVVPVTLLKDVLG